MRNKILASIGLIGMMVAMSGCGATHITAVFPVEKKAHEVRVVTDQEIGYSPYMVGVSIDQNYKYVLAASATATIDAGFKYFSIAKPVQMINQYKDRKVKNVEEAYEACMKGEGSFHTTASLAWMGENELPNCQNIVHMFEENDGLKTAEHRAIYLYIDMHNEDRQDYVTFNAQDVLKSELFKDLNKAYFKPIKYVE